MTSPRKRYHERRLVPTEDQKIGALMARAETADRIFEAQAARGRQVDRPNRGDNQHATYRGGGNGTRVLGVDPGIHGGLAIIETGDGAAPRLIEAIDIPVAGVGAKERVDVLALRDWVTKHQPQHAFVERAQAMPRQGASSGFKYGRAVGAIEGVIAACEIPLTIIEASTWKGAFRLLGGDKESARQRALQLFPAAHAMLARKKDHGRAEAALIALANINRGA